MTSSTTAPDSSTGGRIRRQEFLVRCRAWGAPSNPGGDLTPILERNLHFEKIYNVRKSAIQHCDTAIDNFHENGFPVEVVRLVVTCAQITPGGVYDEGQILMGLRYDAWGKFRDDARWESFNDDGTYAWGLDSEEEWHTIENISFKHVLVKKGQ